MLLEFLSELNIHLLFNSYKIKSEKFVKNAREGKQKERLYDFMILTVKWKSYFIKFKKLITILLLTPYIGTAEKK